MQKKKSWIYIVIIAIAAVLVGITVVCIIFVGRQSTDENVIISDLDDKPLVVMISDQENIPSDISVVELTGKDREEGEKVNIYTMGDDNTMISYLEKGNSYKIMVEGDGYDNEWYIMKAKKSIYWINISFSINDDDNEDDEGYSEEET